MFALSEEEKSGLLNNNLKPERVFIVFDRLARVAKMKNKKFKATDIKNKMTLLHQIPELKKGSQKIIPLLAEREAAWTAQQKILQAEKDEAKLQKARSAYSYLHRVTANCKKWNGPCLSVAELEAALQLAEDVKYCVTQELTITS